MPTIDLREVGGKSVTLESMRGRWVFIAVDSGNCDPACEAKLWKMRQVRQAQGKELGRIERVMLIEDASVPGEQLRAEYQGTWFIPTRDSRLLSILAAPQSARRHIYVVDPLGNLMLRFPEDADPKLMIKDMARLLKYSRAG